MTASTVLRDRVRQMASGGAASIAVNVAVTNVLRIVSSMTLTRLLDSSAYGVVGIVTTIAFVLWMLSDVGLFDFIVRHEQGDTKEFLDQLWTIRFIRGVLLALFMIALAYPAAAFLQKPVLAPVIMVWSLDALLDGCSSLSFATAVREKKLWRLSNMELAANVTTTIVSIILAIIMRSYWAMIAGMVVGQIVKTILSYALFPGSRRKWNFNMKRSAELWRFSRYIMMSSMISLMIMQSDKIVLARLMPLSIFGLYSIAVTLATAPSSFGAPYVTRVLFGIYSQAARESRDTLRHIFYRARRNVTLAYMAGVGLMLGAAPLIVAILYPRTHPHDYTGVGPFLRLLLISAVLRMPALAAKQVLIAVGRTGAQLVGNIASALWLGIGGAVGLITGNIMLLVAIVGTVEVPNLLCLLWRLQRDELLDLRQELIGLVAAALGIGAGLLINAGGLTLLDYLRATR